MGPRPAFTPGALTQQTRAPTDLAPGSIYSLRDRERYPRNLNIQSKASFARFP